MRAGWCRRAWHTRAQGAGGVSGRLCGGRAGRRKSPYLFFLHTLTLTTHTAPTDLPTKRVTAPPADGRAAATATATTATLEGCARPAPRTLRRVAVSAAATQPPPGPAPLPPALAALLQDAPILSRAALIGCALAGAVAAAAAAALTRARWPPSLLSAAVLLATAAATFLATRALATERAYAARALATAELADPASRFERVLGVDTHYKAVVPPSSSITTPLAFAIAAYHGFGAGVFSWEACAGGLASRACALVTKHDAPGFGLTARPAALVPYSLSFNGALGAAVLERELARVLGARGGNDTSSPSPRPLRVLMGHSLGGACAAARTVDAPAGAVDALILVAPAIVASMGEGGGGEGGKKPSALRRAATVAAASLSAAATLVLGTLTRAAILLLSPFIVTGLRSAVRSAAFWQAGLAAAWGDPATPPPPALVQRYRAPSLLAGWEAGLICFLLARVPVGRGPVAAARAAARGEPVGAAASLAAATRAAAIPILLVHGDRDALVPLANSRRLAAQLGAALAVLPGRGHTPHEEAPGEFVDVVAGWLEGVAKQRAGRCI